MELDADFLANVYLAAATLLGSCLLGVACYHATRYLEARKSDEADAIALAQWRVRMQSAIRQVQAAQRIGAEEHIAHTRGLADLKETVGRIDERTRQAAELIGHLVRAVLAKPALLKEAA